MLQKAMTTNLLTIFIAADKCVSIVCTAALIIHSCSGTRCDGVFFFFLVYFERKDVEGDVIQVLFHYYYFSFKMQKSLHKHWKVCTSEKGISYQMYIYKKQKQKQKEKNTDTWARKAKIERMKEAAEKPTESMIRALCVRTVWFIKIIYKWTW